MGARPNQTATPSVTARNDDPRVDRATPLVPRNAVAALIIVDTRYLLQLRDNRYGIFFPAQWGCFGGALEPGETEELALAREIREEIGIELSPALFRYFTRFAIDFGFAGRMPVSRCFYEVELRPQQFDNLHLQEGSAMRTFDVEAILTGAMLLTPFDSFALWLHVNRARLQA